jgi:superfamily II RNA helicase
MTASPSPEAPLAKRLRDVADAGDEFMLDAFLGYVDQLGHSLYAAQEEAILELFEGKNVILNTPTGSGKSLVATAMHFETTARGGRSFYTSPIKALVSEKFFTLCREFGPDKVGMMTGDASVNRDAPILCCTAEILANMALREGAVADVDAVIMDEFHYFADRDRGWAWQVPLLTLPRARFLLMSATLGDVEPFVKGLDKLTGRKTVVVRGKERPVPLQYEYSESPLHEALASLVKHGKGPVYLVCFTQRGAAEEAQNLMSSDYATKEGKKAINEALVGTKFPSPYGRDLSKFLRHGIGIHHAGLLPRYRLAVEKLAQKGLLNVICGTDTLGVGINIPIRTVLFTKLCKYDGEKMVVLSVRDFQQISGRAGRKGFDDVGYVIAQAPEHVIENLKIDAKVAQDPAKKKKLVRKKPPERGYAHWDRATFERLRTAEPEPLVSKFQVTHGMLLNVLSRERDGCRALKHLIKDSYERPYDQRKIGRHTLELFKSLVGAGVMELHPGGVHISEDLQREFSLHQTLSLFLLETLPKVEELCPKDDPAYPLHLLSLVESILEHPDLILQKQLDRLKGETISRLKAEGVEYDDRMAALEKLEYPKPDSEFIYARFNEFAAKHPWVGHENIRPKSVAREMYETFAAFGDYVKDYDLQRAEGLVLRYLSEVYKVLVQTVPERAKNDDVRDMIDYFAAIVKGTDASLLEEWERMRDPTRIVEEVLHEVVERKRSITDDRRAFTVLVRNEVYRLVRCLAGRWWSGAKEVVESWGDAGWTEARLEEAAKPFFEDHPKLRSDPGARAPRTLTIRDESVTGRPGIWTLEQALLDDDGETGWVLSLELDLARSDELDRPALTLVQVGR